MRPCTLLTAFVLFISGLAAQVPYQLFRPGVTYVYENPYTRLDPQHLSSYFGIRMDSLGCQDTYFTLHPGLTTTEWGDPSFDHVPAFIGQTVCQDSVTTLLTTDNWDEGLPAGAYSLLLQQTAPLGTRWRAAQFPLADSSLVVWASVDSVQLEEVLGVTDSIKTINFYAETAPGQLAQQALWLPVRISRQYGLVDAFFTHHPLSDSLGLPLQGLSSPALGLQQPTLASVFDQEVGDEWHIFQRATYFSLYDYYFQDSESRITLEDQWTSVDGDTLWQAVVREERSYQNGQQPLTLDTTYRVYPDTIVHYIDLLRPLLAENMVGSLVEETIITLFPSSTCPTEGIYQSSEVYYYEESGCWTYAIDALPGDHYYRRYGGPFYSNYGLGGVFVRELAYYRTADGEECGSPYDFVVNTEQLSPQIEELHLYPNPSRTVLRWRSSATARMRGEVQLLNAQGQVVTQVAASVQEVEVQQLPAGVYWLRWMDGQGNVQLHSWVKQ